MARVKIPGIYMIRNIKNGKIYIGSTKDLRVRWNRYKWAVKSESDYKETRRPIVLEMRKVGIENFEFNVLAYGKEFEDKEYRLIKEGEYIEKCKSDDPKYGYNLTQGNEAMHYFQTPRIQSDKERLSRAKPIVEYDTKTGSMTLYPGGAKQWGDCHGYGKDVSSHTVKRGSLIERRYYLIYALREEHEYLVKTLRAKKTKNPLYDFDFMMRDYLKAVEAVGTVEWYKEK